MSLRQHPAYEVCAGPLFKLSHRSGIQPRGVARYLLHMAAAPPEGLLLRELEHGAALGTVRDRSSKEGYIVNTVRNSGSGRHAARYAGTALLTPLLHGYNQLVEAYIDEQRPREDDHRTRNIALKSAYDMSVGVDPKLAAAAQLALTAPEIENPSVGTIITVDRVLGTYAELHELRRQIETDINQLINTYQPPLLKPISQPGGQHG